MDLFNLAAMRIVRIHKLSLQRGQQFFALDVEVRACVECLALQLFDPGADVLLRGGGDFLGQYLRPLFDRVQFAGQTMTKLSERCADFLLDGCFCRSEHLGGLFSGFLQNARAQILAKTLPEFLLQLGRNVAERYFEAIALGIVGQLLAEFGDLGLQGPD